jgi:hypothetical protein
MRAPEGARVPIGLPLPSLTMGGFMAIEDEPDRFERV